mgnify:CR=1 FL=1
MTSVLIINTESFRTLTTLANIEALDAWLANNNYGIVSLDEDPDKAYGWIALVADQDGPDFMMDAATGEMEPIEDLHPDVEAAAKLEIALELEELEPLVVNPTAWTPPAPSTNFTTTTLPTKGTKMKNNQYLQQLITDNPGISRTEVFVDAPLRNKLISKATSAKINAGDKVETKRYNRRLNRFIRQMRRDGVDIRIERKGRVAHYTIAEATQLEIPFDLQAEARNSLIIGNVDNEDLASATPVVFTRADEDANQNLSFEDLLATLDDEAVAPVK